MTPEERRAITCILDHVQEWAYEDRGYDYSECPSCRWNTKEHHGTVRQGFGHLPGCKLRAALDVMEVALSGPVEPCAVPPPGWSCSRGAGHDGPCAASPTGLGFPGVINDDNYDAALAEIRRLWDSEQGSMEGYALEDLAERVALYEQKKWTMDEETDARKTRRLGNDATCPVCEHDFCQCLKPPRVCRMCGWHEGEPRSGLMCVPGDHTLV